MKFVQFVLIKESKKMLRVNQTQKNTKNNELIKEIINDFSKNSKDWLTTTYVFLAPNLSTKSSHIKGATCRNISAKTF
jgi:hypothetical protein